MRNATQSVSDLLSPEVERHHRLDWRVQRAGWLMFGVVLLSAALGFLGPGPLTRVHDAAADDSFSVAYQSLERYEAPANLRIEFQREPASCVELRLGKPFFDGVTIETISPPPLEIHSSNGDPIYVFESPADIRLRYTPDEFGALKFEVAINGSAAVEVQQFILP